MGATFGPLDSDAETCAGRLLEEAVRQDSLREKSEAFVEFANGDSPRRSTRGEHSLDRLGDTLWIGAIDFVVLHLGDRSVARLGVGVIEGSGHHAALLGEIGLG